MRTTLFCALILTCLAIAGCGGQGFVQAGGKITFDDGSPVTGGAVAFQTNAFMADGRINSDGTFTLSSLKPGDGLPPGTYQVTVGWSETEDSGKIVYFVDPLFSDPKTTTLTAEVGKGGKNQFEFVVTKPKK